MLSASLNKSIFLPIHKQLFMEIQNRYHDYIAIHTDRSQEGNSVACAEVSAVVKALKKLDSTASKFIIYTDSCLQALQYMKLEPPLKLLYGSVSFFNFANKDIIYC